MYSYQTHAPNRCDPSFTISMISSLDRVRESVQSLCNSGGFTGCQVQNPLWFLTSSEGKPQAEVIGAIKNGWPDDPVHGTAAVHEKWACAICPRAYFSTPPAGGSRNTRRLGGLPEWLRAVSLQTVSDQQTLSPQGRQGGAVYQTYQLQTCDSCMPRLFTIITEDLREVFTCQQFACMWFI
jgi:hypothetical protein